MSHWFWNLFHDHLQAILSTGECTSLGTFLSPDDARAMEAEDDAGPGFVIKKRTKARPKKSTQGRSRVDEGPSTGATSSTSTTAAAAGDGDEDQQQEAAAESAVVRRHPQHKSSLRQQQTSKLAFGGDAATVSVKKRGGGGLRPALDLPADAETAAAPTASRYTAEDLSALKTATQTSNQLTQAKFGHLAAHQPSAQAPDEELIPTDNAIAAAKLKRDVLRKSGAHPSAQDYIALDHTASDLVLAGDKSGESRLMREEDELGEGDEGENLFPSPLPVQTTDAESCGTPQDMAEYTGAQDRIAIGSKARQAAERNKRVGIQDLLEEAQDDLEDLEMRRWEDAQIRRSGHDMSLDVETKKSVSARSAFKSGLHLIFNYVAGVSSLCFWLWLSVPINAALPTFNVVQSRLQAALEAAQTAQQYNQSLSDQSAQLESLRQQEAALRHQVTLTSERFEFFQAFQAWVEDDLVAFLDAKMPPLERLEKRNVEVQIERRHILGARRMTAHACELAGWTRRPVLSDYHALRKPRRPAAGCTSTGMAEDDDDDDDAEEPLPLQNFVSPMEATPVAVALSEAEASDLKAASEAMALEQDTILADVQAEDFRDPALGAAVQFKKWRQAYPEEYKLVRAQPPCFIRRNADPLDVFLPQSFAGLVLVQVWEFWARLELARWNPFQVRCSFQHCFISESELTTPNRASADTIASRVAVQSGAAALTRHARPIRSRDPRRREPLRRSDCERRRAEVEGIRPSLRPLRRARDDQSLVAGGRSDLWRGEEQRQI